MTPLALQIGLSSWVVEDGNHEDFSVGEMRRFALEFGPVWDAMERSTAPRYLKHLDKHWYNVCGEILSCGLDDELIIADFGVPTCRLGSLPEWEVGDCFEVRATLQVSHITEFDASKAQLLIDWKIDSIAHLTTPWVESAARPNFEHVDEARWIIDRGWIVRPTANRTWRQVERTGADRFGNWHDRESFYLLGVTRCG